jgi:predicted alpha/beta superfamily hydrolase
MSMTSMLGAEEQPPHSSNSATATPLVVGQKVSFHSAILDEDRSLLIYRPANEGDNEQPFPVIYLLDGRANFLHTAATVDLLVVNARMPRSMVVGIANTDRGRDFTAVATEGRSSGGADRFLEFVSSELIPFVEASYRTAPHRTLIGHSLGGLFAMHALVERPEIFDAVIAISPAVTNDERVGDGSPPVSNRLKTALASRDAWPMRLFITMSDGEDDRWSTDLEPILAVLRAGVPKGFAWEFRQMRGEDHGTTVLGSTFHGLRFINADWDTRELVRNGTLDDVIARFGGFSDRIGCEILPPERMLNLMGYRLLGEGQADEAIAILEYNVGLYPGSANVHDSLGEALERAGRLPGALRCYRRAVARAEAGDDPLLATYRAHLARLELRLSDEEPADPFVFRTPPHERPDGVPESR